jgi:energy-converting hydrogenase Eha subunit G
MQLNCNPSTMNALVWLYLGVSLGRVLFYFPQFRAIVNCPNKASSSSALSSAYFAFSFWVSAFYFAFLHPDFWAGLIASGNALAVTAITFVILWKRRTPTLTASYSA